MLVNITYSSKKKQAEITGYVGPPFSLIERIRMKGVGTSKMQIVEASDNIVALLQDRRNTHYSYLELRPKGLMVGFQSRLQNFVFLIPFWQLNIYYNGGVLSIYSNDSFFKLKPPFNGVVDKRYLKKVLNLKSKYLSQNTH